MRGDDSGGGRRRNRISRLGPQALFGSARLSAAYSQIGGAGQSDDQQDLLLAQDALHFIGARCVGSGFDVDDPSVSDGPDGITTGNSDDVPWSAVPLHGALGDVVGRGSCQVPRVRVKQVTQGRDESPSDGHFAAVLSAAQSGSGSAFEQLFRMFAPRVNGYLRARGAAEPEELTNDVFISVFRSLARFDGDEDSFRPWLFTIARNRLVDDMRRQGRRVTTGSDDVIGPLEVSGGDVETEALNNLGDEWTTALLTGLVPDQRDVLLLRIVGDLTIDQISRLLDKTPGAVKALQRRGLASVKRALDNEGVPLERPLDV